MQKARFHPRFRAGKAETCLLLRALYDEMPFIPVVHSIRFRRCVSTWIAPPSFAHQVFTESTAGTLYGRATNRSRDSKRALQGENKPIGKFWTFAALVRILLLSRQLPRLL